MESGDNLIEATGIVLSAFPVGEYDKLVVLLTKERGKIHAFAKGARRQNSPLISGIRPFCFGTFTLYEGRNSYTIRRLSISNYFDEVTSDIETVFLGSYFLEFADYYSREHGDEFPTLKLLYCALRALAKGVIDRRLVRLVYELRMMSMNGDYDGECFRGLCAAGEYAADFIVNTPEERLFAFALSEEAFAQLLEAHEENKARHIRRSFKSEAMLDGIDSVSGN